MEVLSYEMTAVSLVQRAIAARAGVPSLSLEDAVRNQSADQAAIYDVAGQLSDLPINVTTRVRDMNSLEGYVRRRHRSKPVDVVIMDHLQMLPMSDTQHRVAQMDDAAIRLKRLALDLNCVVIGISQPNRSGLNGNKRLTVSALRDSHGIGANADVVMALHQPELRDKAETRQKVVLHFAKNRFGPGRVRTGASFRLVVLAIQGMKWRELEMSEHNYAGCQEPLCQSCDGYADGYVDGKSKALFEVSTRTIDHPRGCGCDPCQAVAERLRRRGGAEALLSMDEIVEPDRERRNGNGMPTGLEAGLGFLLGIELAEGDGR